jgi:hypothetical protein
VNSLNLVVDLGGWLGAILLLVAFGCNSFGFVSARSRLYQILNIVGSILLIMNTGWHRAWPSTFVNVVWVVIATAAAFKRADPPAVMEPH